MYYLPASFSLAFPLREYKRELNFVTILRLHQTDTQRAAKGRLVGSRQAAFLHPADT